MQSRVVCLALIAAVAFAFTAGAAWARAEPDKASGRAAVQSVAKGPAQKAAVQKAAKPGLKESKSAKKVVKAKPVAPKPLPVKYAGTFRKGQLSVAMRKASVPAGFASEVREVLSYVPNFPEITGKSTGSFRLIGVREGKRMRLVAANVRVGSQEHRLFRFDGRQGDGWVDDDGNLLSPASFVRPVEGGRMSSPYGWRVHPVLGDVRHHNGVDFALPTGSPVFAAQCGTVTEVASRGNYGNLVRIQHSPEMETVYAHLDSFARGVRVGSKVRRGQVIAYVGATGLATGPHLYWEAVRNDNYLDPLRLLEDSRVPEGKVEELRRAVAELERPAAATARGPKG